ncbi:glycoside hydrolase family 2 TIM barrel-domain containing protein [uncultured Kordia sp.]|uniref:beta-mannosidase n=1 Tax=uncultured Kordia sp. TaxID=507699 RepID=UPI0026202B75|nr:glycoside hydrolase family 2 TIM barrel-domain containing protein [uncultured Kordia sp.]
MPILMESVCPKITKPHLLNSTNNNWVVVKDKISKTPSGDQDLPAITKQGIAYSIHGVGTENTIPAVVPGTILNTLLRDRNWLKANIKKSYTDKDGTVHPFKERAASIDTDFFDPFFDINQKFIPDASIDGGVDLYTYWYYTEFTLDTFAKNQRFWLNLRGINYTANVFINGVQLNKEKQLQGMFLRNSFDITEYPSKDGIYRLAIRIVPPDAPGTPNGGNGGDPGKPNIGEHIAIRHTVGWDWTISIPDRSTGLWDQVSVSTTKALQLKNPKVTTKIKGTTANVTIQIQVHNSTAVVQTGFVSYELEGNTHQQSITVAAGKTISVQFDPFEIGNARLWWPNGTDPKNPKNPPELYTLNLYASMTNEVNTDSLSDQHTLRVGMREFTHTMIPLDAPKKRQFLVNGVPVFIRGGNWMGMDTLFRGDATRYRNEVRMHKEMNLNMIRVWGGGLIERPEFYQACDELGIMVMQEFWFSSEFIFSEQATPKYVNPNPGYRGPYKLLPESYKKLFAQCAQDTILMLRNHASLLFWCAANESQPPASLMTKLEGYIGQGTQALDTRLLVKNSLMVHGDFVGTDGPYGILKLNNYFKEMPNGWTNPLNPEIGSLGIPPVESIRRMIRGTSLTKPPKKFAQYSAYHIDLPVVNESWQQLKYSQYFVDFNVGGQTKDFDDQLYTYGAPKDIDAFCDQAQLTNYMQYKGLWEGYLTNMWDWYTGLIIWKSQGCWTGVRAKLYDWFLEQNGGYWGVKDACEPIHVQLNFINYPKETSYEVNVVNHTLQELGNLKLNWNAYGLKGAIGSGKILAEIKSLGSSTTKIGDLDLTKILSELTSDIYFVVLELEQEGKVLSRNMYWLSKTGHYQEIGQYATPSIMTIAKGSKDANGNYVLQTSFKNNSDQLSFWNRLQVRKPVASGKVGERVLPVFYEHNYFSLKSIETQSNQIEFQYDGKEGTPELWLKGWNQEWLQISIAWTK